MMINNSQNICPEEIEKHIINNEDVEDCIILLKNDTCLQKVICFYVSKEDISQILDAYCVFNLEYYEVPDKYIKIDRIPKTDSGEKIRDADKYKEYLMNVYKESN